MKTSYKLIKCIIRAKIWRFPFKTFSGIGQAILDNDIIKKDFLSDPKNHYSISGYKYTPEEMESSWHTVLAQRVMKEAAIMVVEGKCRAMNPALRALGVKV